MRALHDILSQYRETISCLQEVPYKHDIDCLISISHVLPGFLSHHLELNGKLSTDYHCFGSYCEADRNFARTPLVACRRRGTTKAKKGGYVVVLLFREDMAGCWLSINRGYEIYKRTMRGEQPVDCQIPLGANALPGLLTVPRPWVMGPIDLGASTEFGRCHEAGAAISRYFDAAQLPEEADFAAAFLQMIEWYDMLGE